MHPHHFDKENSYLLLTPTRGLARYLQTLYQPSSEKALSVWQTPPFFAMDQWILDTWHMHRLDMAHGTQTLLTSYAEQALWENIIQQHTPELLSHSDGLACLAQEAFELCQRWEIPIKATTFSLTPNSESFYKWAHIFEKTCRQKEYVTAPYLIQDLIQAITQNIIKLPKKIIFYGFLQWPPVLKKFCDALRLHTEVIVLTEAQEIGVYLNIPSTQNSNQAKPNLYTFQTPEDELQQLAHWCKETHAKNPAAHIACVVTNLSSIRGEVLTCFQKTFAPDAWLKNQTTPTPFHISLGLRMSEYPLISHALHILSLTFTHASADSVYELITSPFIQGAEIELSMRTAWVEKLKNLGCATLSMKQLAQESFSEAPLLHTAFTAQKDVKNIRQTPSAWRHYFLKKLQDFGWPGETSLNSEEYPLYQRFLSVCDEFSALNHFLDKISFSTALSHFKKLLWKTTFQTRNDQARIHILGVFEAIGRPFDQLWITRVDNQQWPPHTRANPFVPIHLQRKHLVPESQPDKVSAYYEQLLNTLLQQAPLVTLSYSLEENNEALSISPYLEHKKLLSPEIKTYSPIFAHSATVDLEEIEDTYGFPWQGEHMPGGTDVLKRQAACPFKAFASYQLEIRSMDPPPTGSLSAPERGQLLHKTLENFFMLIKTQAELIALPESERAEHLTRALQQAFQSILMKRRAHLGKRLLSIELSCLHERLMKWLAFECTRSSFRVLKLEEKQIVSFAGFTWQTRIDRIDEEENSTHCLIDYKTKAAGKSAWEGNRPDEPQLPFYAITNSSEVQKIAFASLAPTDMKLTSYPGKNSSEVWENSLRAWEETLTQLVDSFKAGYAAVDPKKEDATCQYCDLDILCRVKKDGSAL